MDDASRLAANNGRVAKNMNGSWIDYTCEWMKALKDCKYESTLIFMEIALEWSSRNHSATSTTTTYRHGIKSHSHPEVAQCFKISGHWICRIDDRYTVGTSSLESLSIKTTGYIESVLFLFALDLLDISLHPPLLDDELRLVDTTLRAVRQKDTLGLPCDLLNRAAIWLENNTKTRTTA